MRIFEILGDLRFSEGSLRFCRILWDSLELIDWNWVFFLYFRRLSKIVEDCRRLSKIVGEYSWNPLMVSCSSSGGRASSSVGLYRHRFHKKKKKKKPNLYLLLLLSLLSLLSFLSLLFIISLFLLLFLFLHFSLIISQQHLWAQTARAR